MIVDDRKMIIGSANINDRSMRGSRDTEVAVLLDGDQDVALKVNPNGENITLFVNRQIMQLRLQLFKEHFGLTAEECLFPITGEFWYKAWNIVKYNSQIYDIVFKVYPTNKYENWNAWIQSRKRKEDKQVDMKAFEALREMICGQAVKYPWKFLLHDAIESLTKETYGTLLLPKQAFH